MSKKSFAVILSGNGVYDGAEIHEAVMCLYAIQLYGGQYQIFAPDIRQYHVINHLTGEEMDEERNVLVEGARIARGKIMPLSDFDANDYDILIMPGGFGAAKNLSTFAFDGPDCTINTEVERAIISMHKAGKAIGALCISPVIVAKVLKDVEVTIGQDEETSAAIETMGAKATKTNQQEITIDYKNKVVTNPCYMLDSSIVDIAEGAKNTVKALIEL
ncbi:MAG: isoprenoid biosynthesis glyoxalase ElbB [Bacteroidales bacterium]|nr:isoprenoid biosynthesis glyoxalase ElbB [Bacteroidales bacterium]